MNEAELKSRVKAFALGIIRLVATLPATVAGRAIASQLVRSGTSVAANYRAACRARSAADFAAKLALVVEEADESVLWLELVGEAPLLPAARVQSLLQEANELLAIMNASWITACKRRDAGH